MIICIPSETDQGLNAAVYGHFGSAPYFTIINTETNTHEVVASSNSHHIHGSCQPVELLNKYAVKSVITCGMGGRAVMLLKQSGINVYLNNGNTVAEALSAFNAGKLAELSPENACSQHSCH